MGFGSKLKKIVKKADKVLTGGTITGAIEDLGNYAKDFKDWYDGTDAMKKQAKLQDEYNMKYWQMQNEYNSPAAQMQRFIDAGLNPNLAYTMSNTAGDIGRVSVNAPEAGASQINKVISAISAWQGIKNMKLQNANLSQQNALLGNQSDYTAEQVRRMQIDNDWLEKNGLSTFSDVWDKRLGRAKTEAQNLVDYYDVPETDKRVLKNLGLLNPGAALGGAVGRKIINYFRGRK